MGGQIINARGRSEILLVCEHASNFMPAEYDGLGLDASALESHIAWDPGAAGTARFLAEILDAVLVEGTISRLIYDCNRAPDSPTAIPEVSEIFDIPGNRNLSPEARRKRVDSVYLPFYGMLEAELERKPQRILVTVHSFTPIFHGQARDVEVGILDDGQDTWMADTLICLLDNGRFVVKANEPYGPKDGVAQTLIEHGAKRGLLNVMLEIRNDLIATPEEQAEMAAFLAPALVGAVAQLTADMAK